MSYTQSQAYAGKGSTLARSDDATPTPAWTSIGEVKSIAPAGAKIDEYDASNMESGIFKEWKAGMIDQGEVAVVANSVPSDAGQAILRSDFEAGTIHTWGIKLPVGSITTSTDTAPEYYTFKAFIKDLSLPDLDTTKLAEIKFTLHITGSITVVAEGTVAPPF